MRKASPPPLALEAVPLLALLLVPLIPYMTGADGIDREDALESDESTLQVTLDHTNAPSYGTMSAGRLHALERTHLSRQYAASEGWRHAASPKPPK